MNSPSERRAYQLIKTEANQKIDELVALVAGEKPASPTYGEMLTTILKMLEEQVAPGDLNIVNRTLKELRYAFKIFREFRAIRKVSIFGSSRAKPGSAVYEQARAFGERMVEAGFMVITGAGPGIMEAGQQGAGREASFGLNIRLPFEQEANVWIADDPKLINFTFFFTRKLFFVKESHAIAFFPGGFGTLDEAFETLTLAQTGKTPLLSTVFVDEPGGTYWKHCLKFLEEDLLGRGMISPEDLGLFRVTDAVDTAVREIVGFYRNYHSMRFSGDDLVIRLHRSLPDDALEGLQREFAPMLQGPIRQGGPLPGEGEDPEVPGLPRLALRFDRKSFGLLRCLIDAINRY